MINLRPLAARSHRAFVTKEFPLGMINYGVPRQLVLAGKERFGIKGFVETGTFRGDTAEFAANYFDPVYTVEFVAERFEACKRRLQPRKNVTCLQGNSPDALRQIAPALKGIPTLFWLDAHWNGDAASRQFECPVADEVRAINDADLNAFILVDDARYFIAPPPEPCNPDAWPTLATLVELLSNNHRRYVIMVDDAIIAWPMETKPFLVQYSRSRPAAWVPVQVAGGVFYIPKSELPPFTVG